MLKYMFKVYVIINVFDLMSLYIFTMRYIGLTQ